MPGIDDKMLRIGVFYDGGFFHHVSNYYRYSHPRQQRISIAGLHEFIRQQVAEEEGVEKKYTQIVDAHLFRGRFSAQKSLEHQRLYAERTFDDVLMQQGITTHYLPMTQDREKGINVWMSLEAFELSIYKRYNVLVLIAGDSDYLPLIRKVNSLGSRIMLLGWDFTYTDNRGDERRTVTSLRLLNEVTYPILMHDMIDNRTLRNDAYINNLFLEQKEYYSKPEGPLPQSDENWTASEEDEQYRGTILSLKNGYGFIRCAEYPENVFFHYDELINLDFEELQPDDEVTFYTTEGREGPVAKHVEVLELEEEMEEMEEEA